MLMQPTQGVCLAKHAEPSPITSHLWLLKVLNPKKDTAHHEGTICFGAAVLRCLQRIGGVINGHQAIQPNQPIQFIESYPND